MSKKLLALARMLAARVNLNVQYDSSLRTFATDGKTVFIPAGLIHQVELMLKNASPTNSRPDPEIVTDVVLGALAHEAAGHVNQTNFEAGVGEPNLVRSLLNLLEDIRIERTIPIVYPGAKKLLATLSCTLGQSMFWIPKPDGSESVANLIGYYLMRRLRMQVLKQDLSAETLNLIYDELTAKGRSGAADQCYKIALDAINAAASTDDLVLAAKLIADLMVEPDANGSSQQDQQAQSESDSQEGADEGASGSDQGSTPGGDKGNSDVATEPAGQGATQQTAPAGKNGPDTNQKGNGAASTLDQLIPGADVVSALLGEDGLKPATQQRNPAYADAGDLKTLPVPLTSTEYMDSARVASRLRTQLREYLSSLLEDEDDAAEIHGRFDPRKCVQAHLGLSQEVFTIDSDSAPGLDAHIILMLDQSGSMHDLKSYVKSMASGIVDACASFPEVRLDVVRYNARASMERGTPRAVKDEVLRFSPNGSTRWSRAFDEAHKAFAFSKSSRKILITLCDDDVDADEEHVYAADFEGVEAHFVFIDVSATKCSLPTGFNLPERKLFVNSSDGPSALAESLLRSLRNALSPECI